MDTLERLTWAQMRERYPDQWVVFVDSDWQTERGGWETACVLACGTSRADAMANAEPALRAYRGCGCHYTGTIVGPMTQLRQFLLEQQR